MPELLIFDPADNLLAVLSNEADEACFFRSAPFKEVRNQGSFFEFVAQGDHEDSQHLVAENQVAFLDKDGYFRLFVIKEPEQTNGLDGPQIRCVCEPAMNELNDEWIEDVRPYNTTLADAQSRALAGTRWKPGISADLGINSINYFYISVNEAIQENINTWGGELRDRIEIEDDKIIGRYIDILPRRGQDSGKIWEIDKDIISLSHKVQSYPKTALYGRGASLETDNGGFTRKITFAEIEWRVANGDPVDKPKGQEWVGDPGALVAFGRVNEDGTKRHRKGLYENGQQEDPAVLLQETWEALQQQKHQFHNYEMNVFLLEQISGYEHEKVRLGDTTFAIDRSFAQPIEVEQRVISFEYDVADPDNTGTVELGQYIDLYSDDDRIDEIEAKLNDGISIWNGAAGPVTDDKIENITPTAPANLSATGGFEVVQLYWDFNNAIYIANYEVYASQVQAFVPDPSNLVFRGKTSAFAHKVEKNQQWYYRVRAVNTHGVAGPYTYEVMGQTARIATTDILFGSITADLLANNLDIADKLSQSAVDQINAPSKLYTDEELAAVRTNLETRLDGVDGELISVNSNLDTLNGFQSTTITKLSNIDNVLSAHDTSISQNAEAITLKATQSEVDTISGRVTTTEGQISAMAGEIDLKVSQNGIIGAINITPELIRISGQKIHLTGQTLIDEGIIGSAAIANLAVKRLHLEQGIIGTLQVEDLAVTNSKIASLAVDDAKIANMSVSKLKAGMINADNIGIANNKIRMDSTGLYVYKSSIMGASLVEGNLTFYDQSNAQKIGMFAATVWSDDVTKGISMNMEANRYISFGHYVNSTVGYTPMMLLNPGTNMAGNVQGIHMNLPIRMNADVWVGSNSLRFGLNNNHNHASIYKSAGDDLIVASYQSVGLAHIESGGVANTKLSIHPNEVKINVDATFYGANVRFYSDLWMGPKAIRFGTNQTHNHSAIWHSSGNDLIIGSYQAIGLANISSGGVATTKFTAGATVNDSWQDLDMHGWKLLRVGEVDTTIGRMVADSSGTYIQHNTEIRATKYKSTTYVPVRASSFPTGTSLRQNKTDIELFNEDALSVIKGVNTYLYRVKGEEFKEHKQLGLMVDETPRVLHGEAGDSIEMYALSTYLVRGIQQLAVEVDYHANDINELKIENQYLKGKVRDHEERIAHLESLLYAA